MSELPMKETDNSLEITLCGKGSCKCPAVDIHVDREDVIIGGDEEDLPLLLKNNLSC